MERFLVAALLEMTELKYDGSRAPAWEPSKRRSGVSLYGRGSVLDVRSNAGALKRSNILQSNEFSSAPVDN